MTEKTAYQQLQNQFTRLANIGHAQTFLGWDQAVMMPSGGAEARAQAMAELSMISHNLKTDPNMEPWLKAAEELDLNAQDQANLREMTRAWQQANCLSAELVQAQSLATSRCEHAWRSQRPENDWEGFSKNLVEVVSLAREEAQARQAEANTPTPYDAMLDLYVTGDSSEFIAQVFTQLKSALPELIQQVMEKQKSESVPKVDGPFALEDQEALSKKLMSVLGFDFDRGRLDVSTHPFSTGVLGDHRITTRYRDSEFIEALMATAHETGHASYESGLPEAWHGQPAGLARNMSIHESQSLLFEKQLFLSPAFVEFLTPLVQECLPSTKGLSAEELSRLLTRVNPGFIRVEADEVTYPMHVILRYEIESQLINGDIEVQHIPDLWHEKMTGFLGLSTEGNFKDGCMQDIHWPLGAFGYFPSYTLGALNAAQLFHHLRQHNDQLDNQLAQGDVSQVRTWLADKIWRQGSFLASQELIQQATGETTNPEYFISHIKDRYL